MPVTATKDATWEINEHKQKVELTFFSMPDGAGPDDVQVQVAVEGDVLVVKEQFKPPHDGMSFQVRLLVPELYDKRKIKAVLEGRSLVVIIPKQFANLPDTSIETEVPFYRKVITVEKTV
ncbi:hypothetical protein PR202_ga23908 [Eleusine coracana subsp. coracana]|uniref:SHSP domain-containing protein n=1 Tax=Eleusine coracana subsp. coracana TaxID=191504 RepID=A0AAV5D6C1_ELECO|nr:hypothetical protein PR202_ga23908 [Eleusine coracana subsp. coracana]